MRARPELLLICTLLAGCAALEEQLEGQRSTAIANNGAPPDLALDLVARASQARDEDWQRLHKLLASAAAVNPQPEQRARLALALSVGERNQEELERAQKLMGELKDPGIDLSEDMRALLSVQLAATNRRLAERARRIELEAKLKHAETALARATASSTRSESEIARLETELRLTRAQLRAVTQIEKRQGSHGG